MHFKRAAVTLSSQATCNNSIIALAHTVYISARACMRWRGKKRDKITRTSISSGELKLQATEMLTGAWLTGRVAIIFTLARFTHTKKERESISSFITLPFMATTKREKMSKKECQQSLTRSQPARPRADGDENKNKGWKCIYMAECMHAPFDCATCCGDAPWRHRVCKRLFSLSMPHFSCDVACWGFFP